ncbi:MAG: AAA family ATPase [Bradymonadia bacterium]
MILPVPVMVTIDKREMAEIRLPGISTRVFRGTSLAELLDDVALHLMETVPQEDAARMWRYALCPDIQLRRVKVHLTPDKRVHGPEEWVGWFDVVLTRWPKESLYVARVPHLRGGLDAFAVESTATLKVALERHLMDWLARHRLDLYDLDSVMVEGASHLEILEVEAELPTVLPETPLKKKKKKPKKKGPKGKKKTLKPKEKRRLVPPVTLKTVGANLIHRAKDGRLNRAFGRDAIVQQVMEQLERPGRGVLLVGPRGCGKTAIVHEVARRLAALELPIEQRTDLWAVDGNRIIAGMSVVGAWEARVQAMVHELSARQDILYVDDLPTLVFTGRSAKSDTHVASFLEPHLAQGEIRLLGECTPARLEATRREAPGFFARLHIIQVPPMDERDTLGVLVGTVRNLEAEQAITITPEVLEGVLALTRRFAPHQCHPGKAVDLMTRFAGAHHGKLAPRNERGRRVLGEKTLVSFYARETGLPDFVLWAGRAPKAREVQAHFSERIVGQQAASTTATEVVTLMQQGINDPQRPLATLLFVGPTGVGKTETAKALAEYLFGTSDRLVRFDMSEFQSPMAMSRLFGDRWQPEGELTRQVARQPFSVVLFDEIEKAHPQVFDAFLQVFGEGRLTNAAGRTTDFSNTILIMTSNLGVRGAQSPLGFSTPGDGVAQEAIHYRKAAEGFFRPEFFNRIDRVVPFRTLNRDDMGPLVQRTLLQIINRRGLRRSGVRVTVEPALVELLIDQGFDPRYGARSLKRALEQRLTVPLAAHLVAQPSNRTTLVELYREGEAIGMEVWALDEPQAEALPDYTIERWPELELRHQQLVGFVAAIGADEWHQRQLTRRGALLEQYNRAETGEGPALSVEALAELESLSFSLREVGDLTQQVDDFAEAWLSRYDFVNVIDDQNRGLSNRLLRNDNPTHNKPIAADIEMPVAVDRNRLLFERALQALDALELSHSLLRWQIDVADEAERGYLVRLLPATEDPQSAAWTLQVAEGLRDAWSGLATSVQGCLKVEGKGWGRGDGERFQSGHDNYQRKGVTGAALWVRGKGMAEVMATDLGFHVQLKYSGPDLHIFLARVEVVAIHDGDAMACFWPEASTQLNALDTAWDTWRDARRAGQDVSEHPRPRLSICRRYTADAVDPLTGQPMGEPAALSSIVRRRLWALAREGA